MQPALATAERITATTTDSLAAAREAWQRGEFSACLAVLDAAPAPRTAVQRLEVALFRARAHLRLDMPAAAAAILEPIAERLREPDAAATVKMLLGTAVARTGDLERGLRLLDEADAFAPHRTIVAEITWYRALALRLQGRFEQADESARIAEDADADIISARAMQLRAFLLLDQQRYGEAHAMFRRARERYAACRERDLWLAYNIDCGLAALEANFRSGSFRGSHEDRYRAHMRDDAAPSIAPHIRLQQMAVDAWAFALDGDATRAIECAWAMERFATTDAWSVYALAICAAIHRAVGEPLAARQLAERAADLGRPLDWGATRHEERYGLLTLTDELLRFDVERGLRVYARYRAITQPLDALLIAKADPRFIAREEYVAGLVARAEGDNARALQLLARSWERNEQIGCLWHATLALVEIDRTPVQGQDARRADALEAAALIVTKHFPNSFLVRMLGPIGDPVYRSLTPCKRQVLAYLLDGLTDAEIGARTNTSAKTANKHRCDLHAAFGVHTTVGLMRACVERGIV